MAAELPPEIVQRPLPFIALAGLDTLHNAIHRVIADSFTANRRSDRLPIHFKVLPADHEYPRAKQPRLSYDFYVPKGVLKKTWLHKHLYEIPAVAVLFFDLDWDDAMWSERSVECASRIQVVRAALQGRNTKVALVLLQTKAPSPLGGDDNLASERAASLCSSCELSAKHLFILPHTDNLMGYVNRLETAFFELAQAYYQGEAKRVKSRREFLSKSNHLLLFVRHQFKCGFYQEQRHDASTALSNYVGAYNHLMEVRMTEVNSLEMRMIGSYLNYKICRLCFRGGAPRDALAQFRKHIDLFKNVAGYAELQFEHSAWLAKQFSVFGELFDEATRNSGLLPILTQHPGFYFKQAADYTFERRRLARQLCEQATQTLPVGDRFAPGSGTYVGQRYWRVGYKDGVPSSPEEQAEGIFKLQVQEAQANYSWVIIQLLSAAITHFGKHHSTRMRETLRLQLGQEYVLAGEHAKALSILGRSMCEFRTEQWWDFLKTSLEMALRCAYVTAQLEDYLAIAVELMGTQFGSSDELRRRVQANVNRVLSNNVPEPEPECSSEFVEKATGLWKAAVSEKFSGQRTVTQPAVQLHENTTNAFTVHLSQLAAFVQCKTQFVKCIFSISEAVQLKICLRSSAPFPVKFSRLSVLFTEESYNEKCVTSSEDVPEGDEHLHLYPDKVFTHTFRFMPLPDSSGKFIEISSVVLELGSLSSCCAMLRWAAAGSDLSSSRRAAFHSDLDGWAGEVGRGSNRFLLWENIPVYPVARINTVESGVTFDLRHSQPALISEFYPLSLHLKNTEQHTLQNVKFSLSLQDTFADTTHLCVDLPSPGDTNVTSLHLDLDDVPPNEEVRRTFYLQCKQVGNRSLSASVVYDIDVPAEVGSSVQRCHCSKSDVVTVRTVMPFDASVKLATATMDSIDRVHTGEPFLLTVEIRCTSPWPICIQDTQLNLGQPFAFSDGSPPKSQLTGVELNENDVATECFCLQVPLSSTRQGSLPVGRYTLNWGRVSTDSASTVAVVTMLAMPSISVDRVPFYVTAALPAHGRVRSLLPVSYTIRNQTSFVQELDLEMETSESFMFAGDKKIRVRILPSSEFVVRYALFPCVPGYLPLPRFFANSSRQPEITEQLIRRTLPSHIFVMPISREAVSH